MDELIHDFGVLLESITIWNGGPTQAPIEIQVRFPVELWRANGVYELRHGSQTFTFSMGRRTKVGAIWMRPAKGPGFSGVAIGDGPSHCHLFWGFYNDLEWMRATAKKISQLLEIPYAEIDMGSDC